MVREKSKNEYDEILKAKKILVHMDPVKEIQKKHRIVDDILYFPSDPDTLVSKLLSKAVVRQYQYENRHFQVQNLFYGIRQK